MAKFITLLFGLTLIMFFYYAMGWFILNEQNAFIWPWWVKLIYILVVLASWGNLSDNLKED